MIENLQKGGKNMKKLILILTGILFLLVNINHADAKKEKKKKQKKDEPKEVTTPPHSEQIAPMIEGFTWGMTKDQVLEILTKKIQDEFKEKLAKAADPIKEDKLHQTMLQKIKAIKDGYIEFNGQVTGYDSSLVKTEYTHHNNESMLVFPKDLKTDRKWDDYFFFINGKLWKIFRAFDADMFPGLKWSDVSAAMSTKFGENPLKVKKYDPDTRVVQVIGLQWQDDKTLLTLLNYTSFYGIFCLKFEDKKTLKEIDSLRVNKPPEEKSMSVVDAITEGTGQDSAHDIVEKLTKKKSQPKSQGGGESVPPPKQSKENKLDDLGI